VAYIGQKPADKPLGASDITDGIISNSKLGQDIISAETELAEAPADTDEFLISDGGVLKRLDASFIGGANTPAFQVLLASGSDISSGTNTVIAFDTEIFDTDNAVSNGVFTVPSGKAGKYFFSVNGGMNTANDISRVQIWLSKNNQTNITTTSGWAIAIDYFHKGSSTSFQTECVSGTMDLAVGDTVRVYINHNLGDSKSPNTHGRFTFSGHKIIT